MAHIKVEDQIGGSVVYLKGEYLGGVETDELTKTLRQIAEKKNNKAVVDLGKVTYLNSTALGALIAAHTTFVRNGGEIILTNISKNIENIFVITKLTLVFNIADTVEEAINMISN